MAEVVLWKSPAEAGRHDMAARLRLGIFIAIAAFMIGAPVVAQIFGIKSPFLRPWIMFSGPGLGVIDARFFVVQADGSLLPLDRFAMLEARRDGKLRRIESRDELESIVKRLCDVTGPAADIRVFARQATRSGWRIIDEGSAGACFR